MRLLLYRRTRAHYALSHAQKRLWIIDQLEPGNTAYNVSGGYTFEGALMRLRSSGRWRAWWRAMRVFGRFSVW